ncbi:MAG: DUF397 domain-containing protein [Actinophytocola sp.]|uniref:DUF397 domain-containing protein n=1 Tax=Actinophytocola sp. TaxID=1872138 RepID=UPI001321F76C|nr:DUF397 domain-containing protein [Actinophytocola sp.]MPZ79792.1 DUF397 domain-containing protein [Actinophytocola sp.]
MINNWRKSTRSADNSACVETGWSDSAVGYRDTKQDALPRAERPTLVFGTDAAALFLDMIKSTTD